MQYQFRSLSTVDRLAAVCVSYALLNESRKDIMTVETVCEGTVGDGYGAGGQDAVCRVEIDAMERPGRQKHEWRLLSCYGLRE